MQASPDEQARPNDSEDGSYRPLSEDEESLGNEYFIVPEEPLEQERFKRQLIATTRSLKRSSSSFKLTKICSLIGGLTFWQSKNTASDAQPRVTRSEGCYPVRRRGAGAHTSLA